MLMYDLDKRELSQENRKLLRINVDIIVSIEREISAALLRNREAGQLNDEAAAKDEFMILVGLALRHGIEAIVIAHRLGVTISTVHRWARGTFVPAQPYVREAVLSGIRDLLQGEINRFPAIDHEEEPDGQSDHAMEGRIPKIDVDMRQAGGEPVDTVIPLRSAPIRKQKRRGSSGSMDALTSKVV